MLDFVKEAFKMEKERQEMLDLHCEATVDGYTDFIFINRFGQPQHQSTLNKAIRRIIRDCNDEQFLKMKILKCCFRILAAIHSGHHIHDENVRSRRQCQSYAGYTWA